MHFGVTHLSITRQGIVSAAGIDLDTNLHVRPLVGDHLPHHLLAWHGGVFDIGRVIDLGETRFVGRVPEVEDRQFDPEQARTEGELSAEQMRHLLEEHADDKLGAIFGPDLERIGPTCVIEEGGGLRSLGNYWAHRGKLFIDDKRTSPRIRFSFRAGSYDFTASVTDVRLFEADHITPSAATVEEISAKIAQLPRVLVSVGLSRAYRRRHDEPSRHWFRINNFHLPGRETWTLAEALKSR